MSGPGWPGWPGWLGRLSPSRRRLHLVVLAAVFSVLAAVGGSAVARALDDPPPVDQARRGPVVLVPGYGGSTASLDRLEEALDGDGRVEVLDLPDEGTGDLREQAQALDDVVDRLLEETGAPSVDLVGYSAGGVVVRWYVAELGGAEVTRRVITLSTPHAGTDLAALAGSVGEGACPEACQQLAPGSEVLRALADDPPSDGEDGDAGPRWLSVWSATDEVVVPPSSSQLDGVSSVELQRDCGLGPVAHGEVPENAVVVGLVQRFLAGDGAAPSCRP